MTGKIALVTANQDMAVRLKVERMNEPRCIAQLLRNESPRAIDFTITHGTRSERMQITRIRVDLAQNGIRPQRWELEALARGATVNSRIRLLKSGRDFPQTNNDV